MLPPLILLSLLSPSSVLAIDTVQSIISQYNLNGAAYQLGFPSTTLNSDAAAAWVVQNWHTVVNHLDWGDSNVVFSPDPDTSSSTLVRRQSLSPSSIATAMTTSRAPRSKSSTLALSSQTSIASPASTDLAGQSPVLRIGYPQGSYSSRTGGTQFTSNYTAAEGQSADGNGWERMLLTYDVWFPNGYAWTQGGKLPGLRGGPDKTGCSGGNQPDGTSCFSTRLMWRGKGAGEVYAYIPPVTGLCSQSNVVCNSDYGTSLGRGSFSFATGQWQTIYLLTVLNEVGKANGLIELWYNGVPALQFPASVLRTTSGISGVTGMFFSTFFGGDDSTWATPTQQYIYFKNIAMYAGDGQSTASGSSAPTGAVGTSGSSTGGSSTNAASRSTTLSGWGGWAGWVAGAVVGGAGALMGVGAVGLW